MPVINADIVLCDIEGTTTSISFVKDVLFPFAKNHCEDYFRKNWMMNETKRIVLDLLALPEYKDFQQNSSSEHDIVSEGMMAEYVTYLIEKDLKVGPLKTLQGMIWEQGYSDETIKGHIYEDVPKAFEKWTKQGIKICIYSSGSVKAQKLLFNNSEYGNLRPYLTDYFDTAIGNKREAKSYAKIVEKLDSTSEKILFLTDVIAEGEAARGSGLQVVILDRPGNAPLTQNDRECFTVVSSFGDIEINKS